MATSFMFPSAESFQFSNLKVGDVYTGQEIIAPFTFYINKTSDEIARDRKNASEKIPPVFTKADSVGQQSLKKFDDLFLSFYQVRDKALPDSVGLKQIDEILSNEAILIERELLPYLLNRPFPSAGIADNSSAKKQRKPREIFDGFRKQLRGTVLDMFAIGLLNRDSGSIPPYTKKISLVTPEGELLQNIDDFYRLDTYHQAVLEKLRQAFNDNEVAIKIGYPIVTALLTPNLIFDSLRTEQRLKDAISTVALSKGIVLENERIVNKHEVITLQTLDKLNSLAAAKAEREQRAGGGKLIFPYIGRILTIVLAFSFTLLFLGIARRKIFSSPKRMLMLFSIFMLIIIITFLINTFEVSANLKFLIPIPIAAMLLTIFYDSRTAFIGTVTLSIIVGAMRGNDFGIMVVSLFAGTMSTFAVREIQARNWILKGIIYLSGAYILSITTVELLKYTDPKELWDMWNYALINGLLSPILAYGLMIIFEYVFQMTTNSTLLELSDLNKPLLRDLAIRAPGTYHHSIMVGNLSEAASEAVGANALLARVAAYYHDIGKMEKPEYFVENQKAGKNPHDKLTPTMSCLILINHVKRGLDIAEEYNLPHEIRYFIAEHHGTNLIQFFYQKAVENSDEENEVEEANFRYPGPKPRSRETGIVMLADAVEAGSRALKDPSMSRIRSMIESMIHERLLDAELDDCPLTIRDLKLIRESFVKTIAGMFHGRIEYPKQEEKSARKNNRKLIESGT